MKPTIELCLIDMEDRAEAMRILRQCRDTMPYQFFYNATLCDPGESSKELYDIRHVRTPFNAGNHFGYNVWRLREYPRLFAADFYLTIHADGYILNPQLWDDSWLQYDYIGAPWNTNDSGGNGGFCLTSRRFGLWCANHPAPLAWNQPSDTYISCVLEKQARTAGFKYAPLDVALKFSLENTIVEHPRTLKDVFGFHGKGYLKELKHD